MKKTISAALLAILLLAAIPILTDGTRFTAGTPAFALCIASEIKNDCCFKFYNTLEGEAAARDEKTREKMAVSEFRRCLRSDIGCSVEMTEMKSKSAGEIRQICR